MYPVLFSFGPFTIYSYGTMMAVAFLTAGYLTSKELGRKGLNAELASSLVFWAAVGGLAGSKLWSIAEDWPGVIAHPLQMIFTGSGFVWYGGLVGGAIGATWVVWRHRLPWLDVVDSAAPGLALGHGIGRIGCQLAGDGDWGKVSDVAWAMAYPNAIVGWPYPPEVRVHPTPLYEFAGYSVIFLVLWSIRTRSRAPGSIFWWYLVLAPAARFLIEFVRINRAVCLGMSTAQIFSLALVGIGAWQLWSARNRAVPDPIAPRTHR